LYTAYTGSSNTLKVSYKIPLTSLDVKASYNIEEFQTEFSITSPIRSCTLKAASVKERNEWLDALHTAIEDHQNRKRTFREKYRSQIEEMNLNRKPGIDLNPPLKESTLTIEHFGFININ